MKFLSEFKSCYGGGLIVAAAEDTADTLPQQQPPVVALNHSAGINHAVPASRTATANRGRLKKVQSSSAGNWKPELSVIFENSVVVSDVSKQMSIRSDKKNSSAKPKSTVRSSSYGGGDDYRKSIHPMALPAFSPTPFLF